MTKGRKKIPDSIKKLQGTDQPCRVNDIPTVFDKVDKIGYGPRWLNKHGKQAYQKIGKMLIASNVLEVIDTYAFALMCNEIGTYIEASETLMAEGMTIIEETKSGSITKVNPWVKIRNDAYNNAGRMMGEFGFTPGTRNKILSLVQKKEEDPFKKFLNS